MPRHQVRTGRPARFSARTHNGSRPHARPALGVGACAAPPHTLAKASGAQNLELAPLVPRPGVSACALSSRVAQPRLVCACAAVLGEIVATLASFGVGVDQMHPESGAGAGTSIGTQSRVWVDPGPSLLATRSPCHRAQQCMRYSLGAKPASRFPPALAVMEQTPPDLSGAVRRHGA